jgi:manganese efflux pump family protein
MSLWALLGLAIGLAMDAFAVSVGVAAALPKMTARHVLRLSLHFGFFQFMMPVIGYGAGLTVRDYISAYDHWVAFGLLAFIGGKMIYEAFQGEEVRKHGDPTRGWTAIVLSVATSIDALAVGLVLSFESGGIWFPSIVIGLVAASLTAVGMTVGRKLGALFGSYMEVIGGLVLIGIGVSILVKHVF